MFTNTEDELYARCKDVTQKLLVTYEWTLIDESDTDFLRSVLQLVNEGDYSDHSETTISDAVILRAVKRTYAARLYIAYRQNGTPAQELAMNEVRQFVHRGLLRLTNGDSMLADEGAQEAVLGAWRKWDTVTRPGSFLKFTLQIGVRHVLTQWRKEGRLSPLVENEMTKADVQQLVERAKPLEETVAQRSLRDRLLVVLKKCLARPEEWRLLIELFVNDLSYPEISKRWGKPASYLQVIKFRALKNLSACRHYIELRRDWSGGGLA